MPSLVPTLAHFLIGGEHAIHRALRAEVLALVEQGRVRLRVDDDGTGFDLSGARRQGGLGLVSMSERARLAGGRLEVCAQPGSGTRITAEVPVTPSMRYSAE